MDNTFIYTHRKLLNHPIGKKPNYLAVWVYLLIKANHAPNDIIVNNKVMHIKRGEHLGSLQNIAEHFSLSISSVKKIIDFFEREQMVNTTRTRNYTLFQLLNYDQYQQREYKKNTERTPSETNNNDKNEDNDKYIYPDWLDLDLWKSFVEHRKFIKAPMSVQAAKLNLTSLEKITSKGYTQEEIINLAIKNGWKGFYEPKGENNANIRTNGQYHKPTQGQEIDAAIARLEREYGLNEI